MSARTVQFGPSQSTSAALGAMLRDLRQKGNFPQWKVAHAAQMDSTRLSKVELGQRLPTREQTAALAKFFDMDPTMLEGLRMADRFFSENSHNPAAASVALTHLRESAGEYFVKTRRASISKRRKL